MRCPEGIDLAQDHATAERECANALKAVKTEATRKAALDKAVHAEVARGLLLAHIAKCKICTMAEPGLDALLSSDGSVK
jgi:hypothetical protein